MWLTITLCYVKSQAMGVPKRLTEMQLKFANLLVTNEGRMHAYECAIEAGYEKDRARITASELQNPQKFPLVVKYIGELREENQQKYKIDIESHLTELGRLRDEARKSKAWSAATNAEVARGKAGALYVEQKMILTGDIKKASIEDMRKEFATIMKEYSPLIDSETQENIDEKIIPRVKKVSSSSLPIDEESSSDLQK
jgi:phage terminase small subunit